MKRHLIFLNDGTEAPPRLEVHQSMWAMAGMTHEGKEGASKKFVIDPHLLVGS